MKKLSFLVATGLVLAAGSAVAWRSPGDYFARADAPPAKTRAFAPGATYQVCFVPAGPTCEDLVVAQIAAAQHTILVQAYSFTSRPIADALEQAQRRGVDVRVLVDKSQERERYTDVPDISSAGIPVEVDAIPAIAHNKVMIFDGARVFTGSFNFTYSAQHRNAENGIVIADPTLARLYTQNWQSRLSVSTAYRFSGGR